MYRLIGGLEMDLQTKHCFLKQIKNEQDYTESHVSNLDFFPSLIESRSQIKPSHQDIFWSIKCLATDNCVGLVALQLSNDQVCYDLCFQVLSDDVENAVIKEVLDEVINYGFEYFKTPCIQCKTLTLNRETIHLLRQVGMKLDEKIYEKDDVYSIYIIHNQHLIETSKMRASHIVIDQVVSFVEQEDSIRALIQTGLRLNIHAPIDLMRDYHFNWFIKDDEMEQYVNNKDWIQQFGDVVIYKKTEIKKQGVLFQIQYKDGVRIDIQLVPLKDYLNTIYAETLCKVILDKDGILPPVDEPNESAHYVEMPTKEQFEEVLTDLWWFQIEVAKAIYRDELPLAKWIFDGILMDRMITLLSWKIGCRYGWRIDVGRRGRWLKRYLSENVYSDFIHLYPTKGYVSMWDRLFCMGPFINKIAKEIGMESGYGYDQSCGRLVTDFLHRINSLPNNATDFNL